MLFEIERKCPIHRAGFFRSDGDANEVALAGEPRTGAIVFVHADVGGCKGIRADESKFVGIAFHHGACAAEDASGGVPRFRLHIDEALCDVAGGREKLRMGRCLTEREYAATGALQCLIPCAAHGSQVAVSPEIKDVILLCCIQPHAGGITRDGGGIFFIPVE